VFDCALYAGKPQPCGSSMRGWLHIFCLRPTVSFDHTGGAVKGATPWLISALGVQEKEGGTTLLSTQCSHRRRTPNLKNPLGETAGGVDPTCDFKAASPWEP